MIAAWHASAAGVDPPTPTARRPVVAAIATLLGVVLLATDASALTNYQVTEAIHEHLERTRDEHGLCRRLGMSTNQMVLFSPVAATPGNGPRAGAASVYWHRPTDRFVQYPGTSACTVWRRLPG